MGVVDSVVDVDAIDNSLLQCVCNHFVLSSIDLLT